MAIADYNPGIPLATDQPANSQGQLLDNFGAIDLIVDVNHYKFNAGANAGKHKFVQLPQQGAKPVISATEMALYTKDVGGTPQMFIERGNGAQVEIPFTSFALSAAAQNGGKATGYTWLASGLIMKFGVYTATFAAVPGPGEILPPPVAISVDISAGPAITGRPLAVQISPTNTPASNADPNLMYYIQDIGPSVNPMLSFNVLIFQRTGGAIAASANFVWQVIGLGV